MKKFILSVLLPLLFCSQIMLPQIPQNGHMQGMPSVADVFGDMTEEQIAEQVKEGQRFIEELQKNGTPEEIKAFDDLLMQTLNSMSESDFNDIQNIAKMVEPHLDLPTEEPKPIEPTVKPEAKAKPIVVESNDVESFQKFIGEISKSIDEIFQKMEGSKDSAEEINTKWKSKATFNNMKRQIYLLKTKRLAEKLSKKDLAPEEDTLVKNLKKFAKDLTEHNNDFKLEDDFGLPTSFEHEKNYLKKTKSILSSLDNHIDYIMPSLEKFLRKWEPEAVEMAKESDVKKVKAAKDAVDATGRKGSYEPSRSSDYGSSYGPSSPSRYEQSPNYGSSGYDNYGYPDYYGQDTGYRSGRSGSDYDSEGGQGGSSSGGAKTPAAKAADIKAPAAKEEKDKSKLTVSPYDEIIGDVQDHLTKYNAQHEQNFVDFMQNDITKYPDATNNTPDALKAFSTDEQRRYNPIQYTLDADNNRVPIQVGPQGDGVPVPTAVIGPDSASTWINNDLKDYTTRIQSTLRNKFLPEFDELNSVLNTMTKNIPDMGSNDLAKVSSSKELADVQRRLGVYQKAYAPIEPRLNAAKQNIDNLFGTYPQIEHYKNAHEKFVNSLNDEIGSRLNELSGKIDRIKRKAKRNVGILKTSETKKAKA